MKKRRIPKSLLYIFTLSFDGIISYVSAQEAETKQIVDDMECDCTIVPFKPTPPCFELCYIEYASKASASALIEILGLPADLAAKVTSLNDFGVQIVQADMISTTGEASEIQLVSDSGNVTYMAAGLYEDSGKLKIVAEKNRFDVDSYSVISVPADLTSISEDGVLTNWAEPNAVETPASWNFVGPQAFRPSAYWSDVDFSDEELQRLRNMMKNASEDELRSLHE